VIKPEDLCRSGKVSEKATLDSPLDHLLACHRRIEDRLATLERLIPHWRTSPKETIEAARNCLRFFDTNGVWHTEDEERSLFPRLSASLTEEEREFLAGLESQHEEAERALDAVRGTVDRLAGGGAGDAAIAEYEQAAGRLCAIYRQHISSEDARLPELGRRILSAAGLAEIAGEMKRRRGLA
jgi:hemerythrin-like domain-containing protein